MSNFEKCAYILQKKEGMNKIFEKRENLIQKHQPVD